MKYKKLFITCVAIFTVLIMLGIFLMIWFWGDKYGDFNDLREEFLIPDLESGGSPQGIAVYKNGHYNVTTSTTDEAGETVENTEVKTQVYFFISSYLPGGQASRIYVIGKDTGYTGYVTLKNVDGTPHTGHVGGIALNRDFLWIGSQLIEKDGDGNDVETGTVFVAKQSDKTVTLVQEIIEKASKWNDAPDENGEMPNVIQFTSYFNANGNASFLYYFDYDDGEIESPSANDKLYVGEFYRKGNYETAESHRVTTPELKDKDTGKVLGGGDKNTAFVYEYSVYTYTYDSNVTGLSVISATDYKTDSGFPVPLIQNIYSVPSEIQGFARTTDGKLVLSQSYGLKNSRLYYYDWRTITNASTCTRKYYSSADVAGKQFEYEGFYKDYGLATGQRTLYKGSNYLYVYFVDSAALVRTYDIPCMSEGICALNERGESRVFVLFESGSKKYRKFVRQILDHVYSFIPQKKN